MNPKYPEHTKYPKLPEYKKFIRMVVGFKCKKCKNNKDGCHDHARRDSGFASIENAYHKLMELSVPIEAVNIALSAEFRTIETALALQGIC